MNKCTKCNDLKLYADMHGQYSAWEKYDLCWRCQLDAVGECYNGS